ncbi:MAG: helix-turn-helix transcriptional regulator [Intrasporangium sp.]|uniref:helix-turn-helix domain-containing protein n=1 Tax=Intrasporangium sp. TaxID=1925024 RepID=UPI00264A278F|nr:helix-turn-helix domain-containing protein [Intrasporangium sp.]MDN5795311.1 helix-turn-helix transcriptional regulator [Intrasporangium sp.]
MPAATQGGIRPGLTPLDGTQSCAPHPAQTCASPGRTLFETTDPEQVGHCFQRAFGSVLSIRVEAPSVLLRIERIDAGGCRLDEVALDGVSVTAEGHDVLRVCQPTGGTIDWRQRRVSDRFGDGDVAILADPQVGHWCRWHDASATVVTVSGEQIRRAAAGDPDARTGRVGFTGHRPFSAAAARQWVHTVAYVTESLTCEGGAAAPLVAGSAARLLAATALATFPNTSVLDERPVDRTDATPETVRRALAFIESSADHPIGVDDIAQAACVTVRAVQLAFRRHLDTTPMAHLRRIRLDRAHEDLHRARPDDGTTVTQVAARWGFPSPSRFSMLYRAEYAQLPSETLRDAGS